MAILLILIMLILVICGVLVNQRMKQAESFELGPSTELSTCPLESKSYLAKNGDTLCCEGSLSPEGVCAKPLCALAQRKDMPSCKTMLDEANKKAGIACPPSLPNYYTDGRGTTGCTDGALNNDRTAPISPVAKTCKIYPNTPIKIGNNLSTFTLNDTNSDSCSIQRRLEITEKNMKIGCKRHTHSEWKAFSKDEIKVMAEGAADFWKQWRAPLLAMCKAHCSESLAYRKANPEKFTEAS